MDICRCKQESELFHIGEKLLKKHKDKNIFAIIGPMGVGKTTFIKKLCGLLGAKDLITSPTFSIINEYETDNGSPLYHFDLYRANVDEVFDLGYEEYFFNENYCFIEWADKIRQLLPEDAVIVEMKEENGERVISF